MKHLALAVLLGGWAAAQSALPVPALPSPALPGTPSVNAPGPSGPSAVLLDGQRLTLSVAFWPGDPLGPAYPPQGPFSSTQPAYYPVRGNPGPLHLTVSTTLPQAALVLRAQAVPPLRGAALPADRVEYSVNGAPWQRSQGVQVVALLPASGQATYDVALRLRLEGDESAGVHGVQLSWTVEAQ